MCALVYSKMAHKLIKIYLHLTGFVKHCLVLPHDEIASKYLFINKHRILHNINGFINKFGVRIIGAVKVYFMSNLRHVLRIIELIDHII